MLFLAQESLGGNAKTSLVIAVANAEEHLDESMQSLQFGSRAMRIITRAVVNERMDVKVDIAPEILAELEQKEDQANALALSLMAKENELEQAQGHLQVLVLHELQPACGHMPLQKMGGRVQLVQLACMHALVTAL